MVELTNKISSLIDCIRETEAFDKVKMVDFYFDMI